MAKLCVRNFGISLDGYAAGPGQDHDNPLGVAGPRLHEWVFATRTYRRMFGMDGGDTGIGATIMGRNLFGPIRGP